MLPKMQEQRYYKIHKHDKFNLFKKKWIDNNNNIIKLPGYVCDIQNDTVQYCQKYTLNNILLIISHDCILPLCAYKNRYLTITKMTIYLALKSKITSWHKQH